MTHTLQLEIPEDIYKLLEQTAEQTKQPLEELAIQWLTKASQTVIDPLEKYIGSIHTNVPRWGERHDELLGEALMDDHKSEEQTSSLDG